MTIGEASTQTDNPHKREAVKLMTRLILGYAPDPFSSESMIDHDIRYCWDPKKPEDISEVSGIVSGLMCVGKITEAQFREIGTIYRMHGLGRLLL